MPTPTFSYLAALDPWLRHNCRGVERTLKRSALTASHLVISDNQAVNSRALQQLLRRRDVAAFLSLQERDGYPPMTIALRHGARDFEDVLASLVVERDRPPIFPWMTEEQQQRLEIAYGPNRAKAIGPLFDIAGPWFVQHVARLNELFIVRKAALIRWDGLEESYPALVRRQIQRIVSGFSRVAPAQQPQSADILALCDALVREIEQGSEVNRSNLFRLISRTSVSSEVQHALALKILGEPYHVNFAQTGPFGLLTGDEYTDARIDSVLPGAGHQVKQLDVQTVAEIEEFPLLLDQIPFSRIQSIRDAYSFQPLVSAASGGAPEERARAGRDLFYLIHAQLSKEPRALAKLGRMRISLIFAPDQLREHLVEAGVTLADVVSLLGRAGGFLAGEFVGQLVGVFGVGGLVGSGVALIIEELAERSITKPRLRREFRQIANQLPLVSRSTP